MSLLLSSGPLTGAHNVFDNDMDNVLSPVRELRQYRSEHLLKMMMKVARTTETVSKVWYHAFEDICHFFEVSSTQFRLHIAIMLTSDKGQDSERH